MTRLHFRDLRRRVECLEDRRRRGRSELFLSFSTKPATRS